MLSSVDRILEGKFNTENHALSLSSPVLEFSVSAGRLYEGSFNIEGPLNVFTEGAVSTTGNRLSLKIDNFSGQNNEIPYSFDASGLAEGDVIRGEIRIISNQGEYLLPYEAKIEADKISTDLGNIKNLFHFTNLARTDWKAAVSLFHTKEFEQILGGSDRHYLGIYKGLVTGENKEQSVEEFLLYIKKKQPAEFIIDNPNIKIENVVGTLTKHLGINRNGWGYSDLKLSTDVDFITLKQTYVTQEDFDGNFCRVNYEVCEDKLHEGRNYGSIYLRNAYNDIRIPVCVTEHPVDRHLVDTKKNVKHLTVDLMKYYEAFRLRKISTNSWVEYTTDIIDKLMELEPDNIGFELMHIQILITGERYNEANWRLEQLEEAVEETKNYAIYCYYHYLTTLIDRTQEHTDEVADVVERIFANHQDEWRLGWLLLYLSEETAKSPLARWERLARQFKAGAFSPVIYVEAYQILSNNPTVMTTLGSFEKQILKYTAKKGVLKSEIVEQFIYLLGMNKNYDRSLYSLLTECYKVSPTDDVLKAIVTLLINTDAKSKSAHEWYKEAVLHSLRITRLYEYYMLSLDMESDEEIPKMVLMYFAFDSTLDAVHNAYLYAYVYKMRDTAPELYESYREAIERFVSFELLKGHNNKDLTYLYRSLITESMITPDTAPGLMNALFTCKIKPVREEINSVILYYDYLDEATEYRILPTGEIYLPIYGSDYHLVLLDKYQNRYIREEEYSLTRFMVPERLSGFIKGKVNDIHFDLWRCMDGRALRAIDEDNVYAVKNISESNSVQTYIRQSAKAHLIDYYFDNDMMDELDELIESLEISDIAISSLKNTIQYMIQRAMYDKAYEWVCQTGADIIDAKTLSKLCLKIMNKEGGYTYPAGDEVMLSFVYRAFEQGKHDPVLANYLVQNMNATSKELRDIWRAANDYRLDTTPLEKRLLEQVLYSNAYVPGIVPIFVSFAQKKVDKNLCLAYLAQISFDFFVNDKVLDEAYLEVMQSYIDEDEDIPFVCKLAYTKFYSKDAENLKEKVSRSVVVFLKEIMQRGMCFAYFKDYARSITYMHRFLDKTIIEYRVPEGTKASIHYMLEKNSDTEGEYVKEEMKNMYHGICVKQMVLFFGERLQYYIVEQDGEGERLTESSTMTVNDMDSHDNLSRYTIINDISIARTLGDYDTMERLLVEYFRNEYLLEEMFELC